MTRFFRLVQTYANGTAKMSPVEDLEEEFRNASIAYQEENDTREDLIKMSLWFLSPDDRRLVKKTLREEDLVLNDYVPL